MTEDERYQIMAQWAKDLRASATGTANAKAEICRREGIPQRFADYVTGDTISELERSAEKVKTALQKIQEAESKIQEANSKTPAAPDSIDKIDLNAMQVTLQGLQQTVGNLCRYLNYNPQGEA